MLVTRTGPFASAASGVSSGQQDYFALINANGGINGVKIRWEECEFEYRTPRALECYERYRGQWKIVYPNSTPAIFAMAERLTEDKVLGINLAGIAVVLDLLDRLRALQRENERQRNRP